MDKSISNWEVPCSLKKISSIKVLPTFWGLPSLSKYLSHPNSNSKVNPSLKYNNSITSNWNLLYAFKDTVAVLIEPLFLESTLTSVIPGAGWIPWIVPPKPYKLFVQKSVDVDTPDLNV